MLASQGAKVGALPGSLFSKAGGFVYLSLDFGTSGNDWERQDLPGSATGGFY